MRKLFAFMALVATPAHALTNEDAGALSYSTMETGVRLCQQMLEASPPHRAQWFRDNTKNTNEAFLALVICDSYVRGRSDGRWAEQERKK